MRQHAAENQNQAAVTGPDYSAIGGAAVTNRPRTRSQRVSRPHRAVCRSPVLLGSQHAGNAYGGRRSALSGAWSRHSRSQPHDLRRFAADQAISDSQCAGGIVPRFLRQLWLRVGLGRELPRHSRHCRSALSGWRLPFQVPWARFEIPVDGKASAQLCAHSPDQDPAARGVASGRLPRIAMRCSPAPKHLPSCVLRRGGVSAAGRRAIGPPLWAIPGKASATLRQRPRVIGGLGSGIRRSRS
jgi:hypothetical protein